MVGKKKNKKKEKTLQQQKGIPTLSADVNERALAGNSNDKYQCKSNCTKIKHIKDSHQVRKCTRRGGGGLVSEPHSEQILRLGMCECVIS